MFQRDPHTAGDARSTATFPPPPKPPGAIPEALRVTVLSLPPRTRAALDVFLQGEGRSMFVSCREAEADVAIFDFDHPVSRAHWERFHARSQARGIVFSVARQCVPDTVWVGKPVTYAALAAAATQLQGQAAGARRAPERTARPAAHAAPSGATPAAPGRNPPRIFDVTPTRPAPERGNVREAFPIPMARRPGTALTVVRSPHCAPPLFHREVAPPSRVAALWRKAGIGLPLILAVTLVITVALWLRDDGGHHRIVVPQAHGKIAPAVAAVPPRAP
ncbi:MAG: hypothetical protein HY778_16010 [Betaproteobacteria bacterium]|nr:hypothetical protein [Betaproteobacteria bacterium]